MLSPSHTVITYNIPIQGKTLIFFLNQKKEKKKKLLFKGLVGETAQDRLEKQHKTSVRTIGMGRDYWTGGDGIEFNATQLKAKDCRTHSRCSYGSRSTS